MLIATLKLYTVSVLLGFNLSIADCNAWVKNPDTDKPIFPPQVMEDIECYDTDKYGD